MRKIVYLSFFSILLLTSCKKTWTCNCEIKSTVSGQMVKSSGSIPDQKKSDAETICANNEANLVTLYSYPGAAADPSTASCELQ